MTPKVPEGITQLRNNALKDLYQDFTHDQLLFVLQSREEEIAILSQALKDIRKVVEALAKQTRG